MSKRTVGGLRVEGVADLEKKLRKLVDSATADDAVVSSLMKGAEAMRRVASAKAPVLTGDLSRSIFRERVDNEMTVQVGAGPGKGLGSRRSYYAHMQEFGTKHHAAQPFMRPAFDGTKRAVVEIVRRDLRKSIEAVAAK